MARSYKGTDRVDRFFAHYGRKGMKRGMNIYNPNYKPIGEKAKTVMKGESTSNQSVSADAAKRKAAEGQANALASRQRRASLTTKMAFTPAQELANPSAKLNIPMNKKASQTLLRGEHTSSQQISTDAARKDAAEQAAKKLAARQRFNEFSKTHPTEMAFTPAYEVAGDSEEKERASQERFAKNRAAAQATKYGNRAAAAKTAQANAEAKAKEDVLAAQRKQMAESNNASAREKLLNAERNRYAKKSEDETKKAKSEEEKRKAIAEAQKKINSHIEAIEAELEPLKGFIEGNSDTIDAVVSKAKKGKSIRDILSEAIKTYTGQKSEPTFDSASDYLAYQIVKKVVT